MSSIWESFKTQVVNRPAQDKKHESVAIFKYSQFNKVYTMDDLLPTSIAIDALGEGKAYFSEKGYKSGNDPTASYYKIKNSIFSFMVNGHRMVYVVGQPTERAEGQEEAISAIYIVGPGQRIRYEGEVAKGIYFKTS